MRTRVLRLLVLGMLVAVTGLSTSAQQGAGPASPPKLERWLPEQLSKPGPLGNWGNYNSSIQLRRAGAAPEIHDGYSHILVFTGGSGTVTLGGEIVDGPDGKKMIRGGDTQRIVLGAIYHIPYQVPHQALPDPGTSGVTYFVTSIYK